MHTFTELYIYNTLWGSFQYNSSLACHATPHFKFIYDIYNLFQNISFQNNTDEAAEHSRFRFLLLLCLYCFGDCDCTHILTNDVPQNDLANWRHYPGYYHVVSIYMNG